MEGQQDDAECHDHILSEELFNFKYKSRLQCKI